MKVWQAGVFLAALLLAGGAGAWFSGTRQASAPSTAVQPRLVTTLTFAEGLAATVTSSSTVAPVLGVAPTQPPVFPATRTSLPLATATLTLPPSPTRYIPLALTPTPYVPPAPTPFILYMTQEQFAYACITPFIPGTNTPCPFPTIPPNAQIVIIPGGGSIGGATAGDMEEVAVISDVDYNLVLISRRSGEKWLIEYGVGCLSLSYTFSDVYVYSPGLFAGIGSKIVIPDRGQDCRIWNATFVGF